MKKGMLTLIQ